MGAIARYTTYSDGSTLPASDLNGDFDILINALKGVAGYEFALTTSGTPTLTVDNTGSGVVASFEVSGVQKALVNAVGQFESKIATGTAPLKVASTTLVENLNAYKVGGVLGSKMAKLEEDNEYVNADLFQQFTHDNISEHAWKNTVKDTAGDEPGAWFQLLHSTDKLKFSQSIDGAAWEAIFRLDGANEKAQIYQGSIADTWEDVASEPYVDGKLTTLSFGAFYEAALNTAAKQATFVTPDTIELAAITKIKATYQSGTVTVDSIVKLHHYDDVGAEQSGSPYSLTLADDLATGTVTEEDVTDFTLEVGDQLQWVVDTAGGHAEVTVWAQGVQEVI